MKRLNIAKISIAVIAICVVSGSISQYILESYKYFKECVWAYKTLNNVEENLLGPEILEEGLAEKLYSIKIDNKSLLGKNRPILISDSQKSFRIVNRVSCIGYKITELDNGLYSLRKIAGLKHPKYVSMREQILWRHQANDELETLILEEGSDKKMIKEEIRSLGYKHQPKK